MRVLVLGGTGFLSGAIAAEAVRRGHETVCAARGESGALPEGARLVPVDRSVPDGLTPLAGQRFDAVVDVAKISQPWVAEALRVLGADAGHWTFVSSMNVYPDMATQGLTTAAPVHEPLAEDDSARESTDPDRYGRIKVASENTVREVLGERALVVRAGLITGLGDTSDRFGYWPGRLLRGGRVLVPDVPDQPIQHIDVRDLARWVVDSGERGESGTVNAVGPHRPLPELLREIAAIVNPDAELVPVGLAALTRAGVQPWAGPRSLPLLAPEGYYGFCAHQAGPEGLRLRPLAETVADALTTERALGLDRERRAGLSPAEEASVLASITVGGEQR